MVERPWLLWYSLKIGLPYEIALDLPHGELLDLIAVEQIKNENYTPKSSEEQEFWELLKRK